MNVMCLNPSETIPSTLTPTSWSWSTISENGPGKQSLP